MYDVHLHSRYSDGMATVAELIKRAARAGITGLSLTDHDGLGGVAEATTVAAQAGLECIEGIEVSSQAGAVRTHILGYSRRFNREVIASGLAKTRAAHYERIEHMAEQCHAAGYTNVSLAMIVARRDNQVDPSYGTYDIEQELMRAHSLTANEAHALTVPGGDCYLGYQASEALTAIEAIDLIHEANGIAVLAHPGIIGSDVSEPVMHQLITELAPILDGLEIYHPYHNHKLVNRLTELADQRDLLPTGGSDWHGDGRYDDNALGQSGLNKRQWRELLERLS